MKEGVEEGTTATEVCAADGVVREEELGKEFSRAIGAPATDRAWGVAEMEEAGIDGVADLANGDAMKATGTVVGADVEEIGCATVLAIAAEGDMEELTVIAGWAIAATFIVGGDASLSTPA